jgi:2',3'-cyclic-nucleotide 2'-phosphodiesterase (5'-nucleotidase family)
MTPSDDPAAPERRGPRLRIVGVNDVYVLDNLPRLGRLLSELAETDPVDTTLVTVAGDFLAPSLLSSIDHGRGMVEMLNALGVTHVTFGNHEDDLEVAELRTRMSELRARWLGSNVWGFEPAPAPWDVVLVGPDRIRVGLIGVVIDDPSVYRRPPFGGATLAPARAAAREAIAHLVERERADVVVALTHLTMAEDRALAREQRDPPFLLILGGHDHQALLEDVQGTWIAKSGNDAVHAIVAELAWIAGEPATRPSVAVRLEPLAAHPPDAALAAHADRLMQLVRELQRAALYRIPRDMELTSLGARSRQTSLGSLLCSRIRDATGADAGLINGGGLRGSRSYQGRFTYGDLESELPFDNEMCVVTLTGRELADAVAASRAAAPRESGGFLQVDDRLLVTPSGAVTHVAGVPFDPARHYRVALMRELLLGMDHIAPLVELARRDPRRVPPKDSGREVKLIVVDAFGRLVADALGMEQVDSDHDGVLSVAEIAAAVSRLRD